MKRLQSVGVARSSNRSDSGCCYRRPSRAATATACDCVSTPSLLQMEDNSCTRLIPDSTEPFYRIPSVICRCFVLSSHQRLVAERGQGEAGLMVVLCLLRPPQGILQQMKALRHVSCPGVTKPQIRQRLEHECSTTRCRGCWRGVVLPWGRPESSSCVI
jgi:hypothetical protein